MASSRFCWRERTERVNWRMLRSLQLADVVRRGDATLLEPYALHLTFAKLPVVVSALASSPRDLYDDDDRERGGGGGGRGGRGGGEGGASARDDRRNVWFLVRVFQLAMEYLLFLRARDGAVVDSLRDELLAIERESELLAERATKWKARARSGDRQAEKLHQVLQSIAKLLQIDGATPSAVSTIESLLRDLVPPTSRAKQEPIMSQVEEARVCALCGKMFSSQAFLEKHALRRHPGSDAAAVRTMTTAATARKPARQAWPPQHAGATDNQQATEGSAPTTANGVKDMLRVVEQTLHEHQATLRTVAQEEAAKIHGLYEQLHVETQLGEEMRAKRVDVERQVAQGRRELEAIEREKEDLAEELRAMKEQLQFLTMKKRIEAQNGVAAASSAATATDATTLQLELKRLEETISVLNDALATTRQDLQRSHESHEGVLRDKHALEAQLHEARNHAQRLETSLRGAQEAVPTMKRDFGVQTTLSPVSSSLSVQTDDLPEPLVAVDVSSPSPPPARVFQADEAGVQTESEERAERIDSMMQTEPFEVDYVQSPGAHKPTTPLAGDAATASTEEDDAVFQAHCKSIVSAVEARALRLAHAASATATGTGTGSRHADNPFSSLPRRPFLHSRFLHEERTVKAQIAMHVAKLEQTSLRFGVSPKSAVLSNEHVEVVQRALHAHLEVLPAEVLQRMVEIEARVHTLIQSQWMPQEATRRQALERLTATMAAKSRANEGLVRRAMVAFASSSSAAVEPDSGGSGNAAPAAAATEVGGGQQPREESRPSGAAEAVVASRSLGRPPAVDVPPSLEDESKGLAPILPSPDATVDVVPAENTSSELVTAAEAAAAFVFLTPGLPQQNTSADAAAHQPPPESVQEVRRHAIAVRAVKVVSASPTSSPRKAPPLPEPHDTAPLCAKEKEKEKEEKEKEQAVATVQRTHDGRERDAATGHRTPADAGPPVGVEAAPLVVAAQRGPSSFSARHPESQLGIVIPTRYDPNARTHFNGSGRRTGEDEEEERDYGESSASRDLRWSGGNASGRSLGLSDRSGSVAVSSELSFNASASLPSLGSDGVSVSRSFPAASPTSQLPTLSDDAVGDDEPTLGQDERTPNRLQDIHGIVSIREEAFDASDGCPHAASARVPASPRNGGGSDQRRSPRLAAVTAADDDSDIEEVMLA